MIFSRCILCLLLCSFALSGCQQKTQNQSQTTDVKKIAADTSKQLSSAKTQSEQSQQATPDQTKADEVQESDLNPQGVDSDPKAAEEHRFVDRQASRTRIADQRFLLSELRLKQAGLTLHRGSRLVLVTDVESPEIATLPALADQLFDTLVACFGPLPNAVDGSDFQVTGYLIDDIERFREALLLPTESFTFEHGKHVGYQFWCHKQAESYYLRHLVLHEFVHCFMLCETRPDDIPSLWYVEGMAEYFATHSFTDNQRGQFGVLPSTYSGFEGWGRISGIRKTWRDTDGTSNNLLTVPSFTDTTSKRSQFGFERYALSWAACWFLANHPVYRNQLTDLNASRHRADFETAFAALLTKTHPEISVDWLLFCETLQHGFDRQRSWPQHIVTAEASSNFRVRADLDWQDTGKQLQAGQTISITATGQFQIKKENVPWISEADGVTIEYIHRHPLGKLVGVIVSDDAQRLTDRLPIGANGQLTAPFSGRLWVQLNDHSGQRHDNSGSVVLQIQ